MEKSPSPIRPFPPGRSCEVTAFLFVVRKHAPILTHSEFRIKFVPAAVPGEARSASDLCALR